MPSHITPQMRAAQVKFQKKQDLKRGKSTTELEEKKKAKSAYKLPVSNGWIYLLAFVLLGGGVFELLKIFF